MKNIFIFLMTLILGASVAMAATNNKAYIKQAETWLTNLKTAKADFQQIDYQGNVMRGEFYINRPGRLRFQYDAPVKDYIVADGVQIHFYDGETEQVNSGPIGSTLADFILRDRGGFGDDVIIESVRELDDMVNIAVSQKNQEGMGQLVLKFSKSPFELKSWDIIDAQGLTTTIALNNFDRGYKINPSIFKMDNRNLND